MLQSDKYAWASTEIGTQYFRERMIKKKGFACLGFDFPVDFYVEPSLIF